MHLARQPSSAKELESALRMAHSRGAPAMENLTPEARTKYALNKFGGLCAPYHQKESIKRELVLLLACDHESLQFRMWAPDFLRRFDDLHVHEGALSTSSRDFMLCSIRQMIALRELLELKENRYSMPSSNNSDEECHREHLVELQRQQLQDLPDDNHQQA